jgi:hypothetical protein
MQSEQWMDKTYSAKLLHQEHCDTGCVGWAQSWRRITCCVNKPGHANQKVSFKYHHYALVWIHCCLTVQEFKNFIIINTFLHAHSSSVTSPLHSHWMEHWTSGNTSYPHSKEVQDLVVHSKSGLHAILWHDILRVPGPQGTEECRLRDTEELKVGWITILHNNAYP